MSDYISREAAIAVAEDAQKEVCPLGLWGRRFAFDKEQYDLWQELIEKLEAIPAADVEPVRHGRWVGRSGLFQGECSVCGYRTYDKTADWARKYWTYCPNCGTKMYSEGTNDD